MRVSNPWIDIDLTSSPFQATKFDGTLVQGIQGSTAGRDPHKMLVLHFLHIDEEKAVNGLEVGGRLRASDVEGGCGCGGDRSPAASRQDAKSFAASQALRSGQLLWAFSSERQAIAPLVKRNRSAMLRCSISPIAGLLAHGAGGFPLIEGPLVWSQADGALRGGGLPDLHHRENGHVL